MPTMRPGQAESPANSLCVTKLYAFFSSRFLFSTLETRLFGVWPSPRSGQQHKAQGGAEGETLGQVWGAIKPVKRAAATRLSPTSWAALRPSRKSGGERRS